MLSRYSLSSLRIFARVPRNSLSLGSLECGTNERSCRISSTCTLSFLSFNNSSLGNRSILYLVSRNACTSISLALETQIERGDHDFLSKDSYRLTSCRVVVTSRFGHLSVRAEIYLGVSTKEISILVPASPNKGSVLFSIPLFKFKDGREERNSVFPIFVLEPSIPRRRILNRFSASSNNVNRISHQQYLRRVDRLILPIALRQSFLLFIYLSLNIQCTLEDRLFLSRISKLQYRSISSRSPVHLFVKQS